MILGDLGLEICTVTTKGPDSNEKRPKIEKNIFLSEKKRGEKRGKHFLVEKKGGNHFLVKKKGESVFWTKKKGGKQFLDEKKGGNHFLEEKKGKAFFG